MTTEQQEIGALIRAKRKEKKITLEDLGKTLGIGKTAVFHYEKGDTKVIPFDKRLTLSLVLNIPFRELLYKSELPEYEAEQQKSEERELRKEHERLIELLGDYKEIYKDVLTTPNGKNFFQALYNRYAKESNIVLSLDSAQSFNDVSQTVFAIEFYIFMLNNLQCFLVKNSTDRILLEEFFNIFFPQAAKKISALSYSLKDFKKYAAPEIVIDDDDQNTKK